MKFDIEVNVTRDVTYLSYWDHKRGSDTVAEIRGGSLMLHDYGDDDSDEPQYTLREVTLEEFLKLVVKKREIS